MRLTLLSICALVLIGFAAWKLCCVAEPNAAPGLSKLWHDQLYGLDPDEVIRFIPPPYSPQRMKDFGSAWAGAPPKNNLGQSTYHVLPARTQYWGMSSASGTILSSIEFATQFTLGDLDILKDLGDIPADGDVVVRPDAFVVRPDAFVDNRMKALESILTAVTRRELIFEKKPAQRDVIVARGHWQFHPISGGRPKASNSIHFFTDTLDPQEGAGGGSGDLAEVLHRLEEIVRRKVIDEVTRGPTTQPARIDWANNYSEHEATKSEAALGQLLDNVARQTSLEFVRTKRIVPVWFIRDKSASAATAESR